MPPFSMEVKSSSPEVTSGEEVDGSTCGSHVGPVPRRRPSGEAQKKDKNRNAARKSRKKQTEKADELHMEYQCLEQSNTLLSKEITALRVEVRRYVAVLDRHEPVCPLFALSLTPTPTSTCTPTSTSTSIATAALHHGRGSAATLTPSSFWDPPPPPLRPSSSPTSSSSSSSSTSSSSSSCSPSSTFSIHLFDRHPLPPLTPSGPPSSFTPPHPAPAPAPGRASRSDQQGSFAGAGGAILPHHPQTPYPGVPNHRSYLGGPGHESGSVHTYPSGSPGSNMAPTPYGGIVASGPTPLLPPLAALDLVDGLHPAISVGTLATADVTADATTTFSEPLQPLCNFSSEFFLLQTEDVLFPDC